VHKNADKERRHDHDLDDWWMHMDIAPLLTTALKPPSSSMRNKRQDSQNCDVQQTVHHTLQVYWGKLYLMLWKMMVKLDFVVVTKHWSFTLFTT
jgi:hypothetical protein